MQEGLASGVPTEPEESAHRRGQQADGDQLHRLGDRQEGGAQEARVGRLEDHPHRLVAALAGDPEAAVAETAVDVVAKVSDGGGHRVRRHPQQLPHLPVFAPVALALLVSEGTEDALVVDEGRVGEGGEHPKPELGIGSVVGGALGDRSVVGRDLPPHSPVHRLDEAAGLLGLLHGPEVDPRHPLVGAQEARLGVVEDDGVALEADHRQRVAGLHQQRPHPGEENEALAVQPADHRVGGEEPVHRGRLRGPLLRQAGDQREQAGGLEH